ncbi:putative hexosyltransferase MUCI70 [Silene latifolia]|uniref:putative hexosyltransferase MUCI70 n=1 Tax=Silene latifolia TaxID=37657 RepID=UPI003D78A98D
MTPKSLGLRTGSYGSLQLQQSNGVLHNHAATIFPRKPSKVLLSSHREKEKEKCIPCIFRLLCRRKVGMVILACFAVLAFASSFFTSNKEATEVNSIYITEALQHPNIHSRGGLIHASAATAKDSTTNRNTSNSQIYEKDGGRPFVAPPAVHPCKNFKFPPPPPPNRRQFGPRPCPVCYLSVDQAVASMPSLPSASPVLRNLSFIHEENPIKNEPHGGSDFGGYPSLKQRNDSYDIQESMNVHCGFVRGSKPGRGSGFDIDEDDLSELDKYYNVIVASAIFGNYDVIQEPESISDIAKKNVPFFMFIDEETEDYMRNKSILTSSKMVGLWRIIVVRNIPYSDARRNGKVPKLLLHRLFPNVRYSIWIDGKLKLVHDPFQVLERFLWRENATFAISRHYRRFDVFVEAEANKAGGKYENASIDYQVDFYRKEGLTPYSEAKLPITSDVPEGCVIIREHIPVTNLFSCLWFNEVDRFTSRDQLSFSTVRDKIMSKVNWSINMFLDCERRNFVIQAYHRELLENMPPPPPPRITIRRLPYVRQSPTVNRIETVVRAVGRKNPSKRGRERRSGSRRHRKVVAGGRQG